MNRIKEIESRLAEIRTKLSSDQDIDNLDELEKEVRELQEEKAELKEKERRQKTAKRIEKGEEETKKSDGNIFKKNDDQVRGGEKMADAILLRSKKDSLVEAKDFSPEEKELRLGKFLRGVVTGDWTDAEKEKRAVTTSTTGTLIPEVLAAEVIDKIRNKSLFADNVPVINFKEGNKFVKLTDDPSLKFKEEGEEASESSFTLDSVSLDPKTLYGWAYVTLESIEKGINVEEVLTKAFVGALAQGIDNAYINGQPDGSGGFDDFAPGGVLNNTDINTVDASSDPYDDVIKAVSKIKQKNGMPTIWGMNARTEEYYNLLKNNDGDYMTAPKAANDLNKIISNNLPYDETDGSDSLIYDPDALMIGIQDGMKFEIFRGSDEGIKKGMVG
ncbi:MAG: phage major capsid protein, partial [bacterium]